MINITADFKQTSKESPVIPKTNFMSVDVWFVCNEQLFSGYFHSNGCFYTDAKEESKSRIANVNGIYGVLHVSRGIDSICTHWCYKNELKIEL